ncbi:MAG: hypothetical protein R3C56_29750 [Pirellulaceae bacterium]
MSDIGSARILRFERFESRLLLAGEVFEFASDHGNLDSEQLLPINQQEFVRANTAQPKELAQNAPRTRAEPAENASPPSVNLRIESAPLQASSPLSLTASPPSQAELRQPNIVDAAIGALANETSSEVDSESTLDQLTDVVSIIQAEATSQIVGTESLTAQQENTRGTSLSDRPSLVDDSYIDLAPIDPFESLTEDSDPWQLESRTIPLLKQIHERPIREQLLGDRAELLDPWMQGWLGGTGGMIALEHIVCPRIRFPHDAGIVNAGLQSTVALHRSLNLAAGIVTPALSGQVLDAIMASLEKMSASEVQPVIEPSPIREIQE